MDTLYKIINYVLDYINSVPADSWYALGALLAGSALVTSIVAFWNRRRLSKGLERFGKAAVNSIVVALSFTVALTEWVVLNGPTFSGFLGPWMETGLKIIAICTIIYNWGKPSLKWWKDRQAGKRLERANALPPIPVPADLAPAVAAVTTPMPFNERVQARREAPKPELLQL